MSKMVSTRTGFGKGMTALARKDNKVLMTAADTYRSFALNDFVQEFSDRYFEFGIAEQNMLTASATMASEGYVVFSVGYSNFLSMRALEQMRTFIAYPNLNVKVVAGLSGLSGNTDGVTHQGTEDIPIVRSLPNFSLLSPADAVAAEKMVQMAASIPGPVYIRLGRDATPLIYDAGQEFVFGKAVKIRDYGHQAAIIATGVCVGEAIKAADRLVEAGIQVQVLDMHTVKPIDTESILRAADECGNLITVEDGAITGGLGGAVAEVLADACKTPAYFKRMGLTTFGTSGTVPELLSYFSIDAQAIEAEVRNAVRKTQKSQT